MHQRRAFASGGSRQENSTNGNANSNELHTHTHELEPEHEEHSHTHSHSLFGSHSHGDGGHSHGAANIMDALQSRDDPGSRITLIGLFSNIGLTAVKGLAGFYMHSASLLADAGHSFSDLLGDFVTLICWKLSRKPPSKHYPYGFAKYETIGTATVSILLIGGALGIGFHSWHLLMQALSETAVSMDSSPAQRILLDITSVAQHVPSVGHSHSHAHDLDPNAAWFAAVSIIAKEWLYRATKKVADQEKSPVLLANAVHHRSDAYSSMVALFAILGSWIYPALPLDPIGGLLVAIVIFQQGVGIMGGSWRQLVDAGVSTKTLASLHRAIQPLQSTPGNKTDIIAFQDIRARGAGSSIYVDLTALVPENLRVHETSHLETEIIDRLKEARSEVAEVRVKFKPVHTNGVTQ